MQRFFNEGKSISSNGAIDLIKRNTTLNINTDGKGKAGQALVYISKKPIRIGVKGESKN